MLLAFDSSRNSSSVRRRAMRFLNPGASSMPVSPTISASSSLSVARTAVYRSPEFSRNSSRPVNGWRPFPLMGNPAKNMRARSRSCCVTAGRLPAPSLPRSRASVSRANSSKRTLLTESPKYCEATSSSSCASSKTTAAASGRIPASGAPTASCFTARSAKNRWWFTMIMSDSSALRRISVMKQRR